MDTGVMLPSVRRSLNVALVASNLARWTGGNDFLRICAGGLWQMQRSSSVEFSVVCQEDTSFQSLRRHLAHWKQAARQLKRMQLPRFVSQPAIDLAKVIDAVSSFGGELRTLTYRDKRESFKNLVRLLRAQDFDVMVPIQVYPGPLPIPWVGYIPDLQHKHHPEFFSPEERAFRDRQFTTLLGNAKAIIVNSVEAKNDIEQTYCGYQCAIFNLPFAPILNAAWLLGDVEEVIVRYNLPRRYFLISNQFWVHKSHGTAFEALARLGSEHADVAIICTGNTSDYRQPDYFRSLQDRIATLKIQDRIRILGLIPKHDQIQIMRGAVAVIQPTLFEGGPGGGSVYDAVCTGTPAILSDIPINREIEDQPTRIQFFEKANADDLADKMQAALEVEWKRPSNEELQCFSVRRAEALGNRLVAACDFSVRGAV